MSDAPGPLPWMKYRGTEIANAARTMEYLRGSTSSAGWEVAAEYPCSLLYRVAGEVGPAGFAGPSLDPAPWYDVTYPESARFLGLLITRIEGLHSNVTRVSSPRRGGIEGSSLGPQIAGPREVVVHGRLIAEDSQALDYGYHWLTEWLAAASCEACERATVEVYTGCPPEGGGQDYITHFYLYDVGLVDGPSEGAVESAGCKLLDVEFTLVPENSYLYREIDTCLPAEVVGANVACSGDPMTFFLGDPGTPHCCDVEAPTVGTLGIIVTIDSPDGVGGLEVGLYDVCPPLADTVAVKRIYVDSLEAGQQLVIDSAKKRITLIDDGVEYDGTSRINLPTGELIQWLELARCDAAVECACIRTTSPCSQGGATTGLIQTQLRVR